MTPQDLCRNYLQILDSIPHDAPWLVLDVGGQVLIADRRDEASTVITEAIAAKFGEVVAVVSHTSHRRGGGDWLGVLLDIEGDPENTAARLRGAYAVGTTPDPDPDESGPF
ncbi:hypothetical protein [Rhodopirellula sp. P2]|uniref:hypothetical protein n=1 Tax=Rhodopirellula sp. P2 TaxID=2127060 RepID=UPI002368A699|nr:hypothetical protein [Rhodopirellula sp. P2]WDQ16384.1 hypothetical protein PSR62_22575 [Rhodopirellula sp. P2]